jgi:type I restriction enzyme S subunit
VTAGTTKHLGDVATFVRGINFKPDDVVPVGTPGSVACMRTKNVQTDLDLSDVWGVSESFVKRDEQYLQPGDVLTSIANSWNLVGKCCWVPELPWQSSFGGFVSVLRADRNKIDPRYMFHWFASGRIQAMVRSFGQQTTNISNLNLERCLRLPLPLPPLPEQRRIAEALDKGGALRAKRRAALAQLDTLTRSLFLDMFGDPTTNPKGWKRVGMPDVVVGKYGIKAGPFGSSLKKKDYTTDGYRVYGQEQVIAGRFDIGDYYIGERKYQQLEACAVKEGDLLISLVGSFGKVLVVPPGIAPGIINPRLLKMTPNHDLLTPGYLAAFLALPATQADFGRMAHGGTMGILNVSLLKQLQVILPPLSLQHDFERRVTAVEKLKAAHRASLTGLDALFASLQHRAFRGEL